MFSKNLFEIAGVSKPYKVTKPIRLIELFAGIGAQAAALERLGANFEHYRVCEFDKYAIASYNAVHGTNFETSDICDLKAEDLGIVDKDKYEYIMTYSFPCLSGDTLVLTKDGYKTINAVTVGDFVLCHDNDYHEVVASRMTGNHDTVRIHGMSIDEIICTHNHKFFVRRMKRKYPTMPNGKRQNIRYFLDPEWVEAKDLDKSYYLGMAINNNSIIPDWDGITFTWSGKSDRHKNELSNLMDNKDFWWLIGSYVGDGWHRTGGGIIICGNDRKTSDIISHADNCGITYTIAKERTVTKLHFPKKELELFVEPFGRGAENKRIPGFVFDLPVELLRSFLDGYISADGTYKDGKYRACSVSRELIYGISQIVAKVYHRPSSIYKIAQRPTSIIEGRTVHNKQCYQVSWKYETNKQDKAFYENGYIWFPIKDIESNEKIDVYDIEVDGSHSFTANGTIVHNCTDLSVAGKQFGMSEGSGTRSSLLWEVKRLLNESKDLNALPQILCMENVPAIHSDKFLPDLMKWVNFLESLGYSNFWQDMNAKDYGVAQSRNRTFMLSILGNYTYTFPRPIKLTKKMKDYLETDVDEKYFLKSEKAMKLIQQLLEDSSIDIEQMQGERELKPSISQLTSLPQSMSQTVSPQEPTEESRQEGKKVPALLNYRKIFETDVEVATTIMARDSKGFNTGFSPMNGVIEEDEKF